MCLIVFALDCHPRYPLILGANRDEFRRRETAPAGFWSDAPHILAGRDLQAGGTWMGIARSGRLAAVTNYRDMRQQVVAPPSRGGLVTSFLQDETLSAAEFSAALHRDGERYDGFNLLYGTAYDLHYYTNRGGSSGPVPPGIHALSNHLLNSPWPKVSAAKSCLADILNNDTIAPETIISALADPTPFAQELLPDTGIGPERERLLSPLFIDDPVYCTRSTSVILVTREGQVIFCERSYTVTESTEAHFEFDLTH
jgi:uncharacterized protein with NRDE domain